MLDANLKTQLAGYLEMLQKPVQLVAAYDDSDTSKRMHDLLEEIASLSDKVTLVETADDVRRPSFLITNPGVDTGVRFAGVPLGHEFTSLVLALLQVGGHPAKEDAATLQKVAQLHGPLHFETFFSLTCQNCPTVVQALNLMSVLNPQISHTAIEGGAFAQEAEERGVLSVPTVFLNGEEFGQGRMTLEEIVGKLDAGSADEAADAMNARGEFDVLVIGGGPAGATSAIYAARKGIRTGLVAERIGGQVLDTAGIENYPSVQHTEGVDFGAALERHVKDYEVDLIAGQQATRLVPASEPGGPVAVEFANGATLTSKTVVLAVGARWRNLGVPGEEEYRRKGVTNCPHCDGPLFKGKPVAVVGGGNSGVEAAIDLAGICSKVTLVEFLDEMRADEVLQRKLRSLPNVDIVLGAGVGEIQGDGKKVTGLVYRMREDGAQTEIPVDGVFVQIGLLPNTEWLKDAVELTPRGEVVVDAACRTSVPGVFAAGDCTTVPYKQIVVAAGEGAKAALSAFDFLIRTPQPVAAAG